jgi:hypothetical protein
MTWVLIYAAVLALGVFKVANSKAAILLTGRSVLVLNCMFGAIVLLNSLLTRSSFSNGLLIFLATILALGLAIKDKWFLLRHSPEKTFEVVEACLAMVLMPFTKTPTGYDLELADGKARISFHGLFPGIAIMDFYGKWQQKKVEVLRALLKKRFGSIFPKITIRLNNKNNVEGN